MLEGVDDALLDRRDVIARHHAARDLLIERKSGAARQRLDVEHHIAELAVTAGLFLVAPALDDRLPDGLAVTDARRAAVNGDAEAVRQPFGGDAQVHLALAPHHDLVRFRIVHDHQ